MFRGIVFILLGVILALLGAAGGAYALSRALEQAATMDFKPVDALINDSVVTSHRGSKGRTIYKWEVAYSYEFNGRTYGSRRKAFGDESNGGYGRPQDAVQACPRGSRIQAYVDPNDPTRAVLRQGAGVGDFLVSGFVLAVLPMGFWPIAHGVRCMKMAGASVVAAGLPILDFGDRICVSVSTVNPAASASIAAALALGGGTIGNGAATGKLPGMVLIGVGMVVVVAAAVGVAVWMWTSTLRLRPSALLTFDRSRGMLELPKGEGRKSPVTLACAEVEGFEIDKCIVRGAKGAKHTYHRLNVDAVSRNGSTVRYPLRSFGRMVEAESLALWCRERLLESIAAGQ